LIALLSQKKVKRFVVRPKIKKPLSLVGIRHYLLSYQLATRILTVYSEKFRKLFYESALYDYLDRLKMLLYINLKNIKNIFYNL